MHTPIYFDSFLRPMVWGGRRLEALLGRPLPSSEPYGEAWQVSDHPVHHSRVRQGPLAGRTLRTLMEAHADRLLGPAQGRHARFPWLIKFLDASDWLSVQVHPDEQAVRRWLPQEGSKTEAWYVIAAEPGSRIHAGLLPGVNARTLQAALSEGTVAQCLHSFTPRSGDCIFLPAGTVHAVGGGVLLAEVQQTSDATFRLFDWNRRDAQGRSRALHIEESLACIDWTSGPVQPVRTAPDASGRASLVDCPYFVLEEVRATAPFACAGAGRLQALIALDGDAFLESAEGVLPVSRGDVVVFPAGLPETPCRPQPALHGLLCTLP